VNWFLLGWQKRDFKSAGMALLRRVVSQDCLMGPKRIPTCKPCRHVTINQKCSRKRKGGMEEERFQERRKIITFISV
jgi:hypothetical protein